MCAPVTPPLGDWSTRVMSSRSAWATWWDCLKKNKGTALLVSQTTPVTCDNQVPSYKRSAILETTILWASQNRRSKRWSDGCLNMDDWKWSEGRNQSWYPAFITLLIRMLPELSHKRNRLMYTCQVYLHFITWYHDGLPFRTSLPCVFYDSRRGWPRWTREPAASLWWPPRSFQLYLKLEYDFNRISRKKKTHNTWLRTENMAYIHRFISLHVLTFRRQINKAFV